MLTIHPGLDRTQKLIVRPPKNIKVVNHTASRRYGKSHAAKAIIICEAVSAGKRVLYMTPSSSQYIAMYNFFAYESPAMRSRHDRKFGTKGCKLQPIPTVKFISGGIVEFRSLESLDNARGGEFDVVIVDEKQKLICTVDEFNSVVRPMLVNRFGRLYFFGQFGGKNWEFANYFVPGVPPGQMYHDPALYNPDRHLSIRSPWQDALFFKTAAGREVLEQDRKDFLPAMFKQEYECICLETGSGVFEHVDNIIGGESHKFPRPNEVYYIFWDAGKDEDPSAVVVLAKHAGVICNAFSLETGMPYTEQVQWVKRQGDYYRNVCYGVDTTSGGTNSNAIEDFCRPILKNLYGLNFNQYSKEDFVRRAQIEIERRSVMIPREHDELITQLRRFTYKKNEFTQRYSYGPPTGEHDDLVAAFIGALHMRSQNWGPAVNGRSFSSVQG